MTESELVDLRNVIVDVQERMDIQDFIVMRREMAVLMAAARRDLRRMAEEKERQA